jgi:tryptophan synthase alpha chain
VYANIVEAHGIEQFYRNAAEAGVDSVLVADVPTIEAAPYVRAARDCGVDPVLIAAPNCTKDQLKQIAGMSSGYTYLVSRSGVTGADSRAATSHEGLTGTLEGFGAPPCLLGFGISTPEHVRGALRGGAAGAISGSAVVDLIERNISDREMMLRQLKGFVSRMKEATMGVKERSLR